jgi:hypothetical protein
VPRSDLLIEAHNHPVSHLQCCYSRLQGSTNEGVLLQVDGSTNVLAMVQPPAAAQRGMLQGIVAAQARTDALGAAGPAGAGGAADPKPQQAILIRCKPHGLLHSDSHVLLQSIEESALKGTIGTDQTSNDRRKDPRNFAQRRSIDSNRRKRQLEARNLSNAATIADPVRLTL